MDSLMRRKRTNTLEQRQNQVAQSTNLTVLAVRKGMQLRQSVASVAATTFTIAQDEIDTARRVGQLTYHQEQALYHYREAYTHELLSSVENADTKVYRLLVRR